MGTKKKEPAGATLKRAKFYNAMTCFVNLTSKEWSVLNAWKDSSKDPAVEAPGYWQRKWMRDHFVEAKKLQHDGHARV